MSEDRITDADFRRAAALLVHHASNDREGVVAVLDEAEEAGRLRHLAWTMPSIVGSLLGDDSWHTEATAGALRVAARVFGEREHEVGR